jgi:DNA repair exonuclease SbcCD ATPase subunit
MDEMTVARSGAEIAAEINIIKKQTARVCLSATVEIGQLLVEAKAAVPFGEWGVWLERNVAYSQSTANNIMRLYQEYGEQEQIGFFEENRMEIFGDLTPSQAVALLGLEPAERKRFVETHDMETVSVRDIQKEIKARQEAEALAAAAREELQNAKRLAEDLKDQLSKAQSASGDAKASEKELRDKLKKQFEAKLNRETAAIQKEAADAKKALDEAESKAAADKSAALSAQREELSSAYAEQLSLLTEERDRAIAASQNAGNESIARFSVIFENIQTELSQLRELAEQVEKDGDANKSSWLIGCVKRLFAQIAKEW